ncbi:MAG: PCI domain-containing protein [Candidatus Helarchaeota archaeon]
MTSSENIERLSDEEFGELAARHKINLTEKILFENNKNGYCGLLMDVKYFETFWRTKKRRAQVDFKAEIKATEKHIFINPLKIKLNPIKIVINDIISLEKSGEFENEDYLHSDITWIQLKDTSKYKIYFKDEKKDIFDPKLNNTFFEAVNWTFRKVQKQREDKYIKKRLKTKLQKINKFKNVIKEYLFPYYEIKFEKIAQDFNLDLQIVETEIKKLIKDNVIHARVVSDGIVLNTSIQSSQQPIQQSVFITMPEGSELYALSCPLCHASLPEQPPCICDYCGELIQLKNSQIKDMFRNSGIMNRDIVVSEPTITKNFYDAVKEDSAEKDELDEKFESIIISMNTDQLIDYLKAENRNPQILFQKVTQTITKHNFNKSQVIKFLKKLKTSIDNRILWNNTFEKSWKGKIIDFLLFFSNYMADKLLTSIIIAPIIDVLKSNNS